MMRPLTLPDLTLTHPPVSVFLATLIARNLRFVPRDHLEFHLGWTSSTTNTTHQTKRVDDELMIQITIYTITTITTTSNHFFFPNYS